MLISRHIVLARRPDGNITPDCFRLETRHLPAPRDGELLLRTLFLSVDPYMRGSMNENAGYALPTQLDHTMTGGTVSEVLQSRAAGFLPGDIVVGYTGWCEHALVQPASALMFYKVDESLGPVSTALGVLGMPGHTAYFGLSRIGRPRSGETLVVSAAAGTVGSIVGQLGRLDGCRVVGIAGGPGKCAIVRDEFGFDACVDYKSPRFREQLRVACPQGVDIYFENVGGPVLDAVAPLLNDGARVPICGYISDYNKTVPGGSPMDVLAAHPKKPEHRLFIVTEWMKEFPDATRKLGALLREGRLRYRETIVDGLDQAPAALAGLFRGENVGKMLVRIAARTV